MKRNAHAAPGQPILLSEGKLLEICPIIVSASGQPFMLPPVTYKVDNWLLGYSDEHVAAMPYGLYGNERMTIPGSSASNSSMLQFLARVLEDHPASEPAMGARIDADAVREIVAAIKEDHR
jgi:hypothetical protein